MSYLLDANILIYAHRSEDPHHAASLRWLQQVLTDGEQVYASAMAEVALLRITTNKRMGLSASPPAAVFELLTYLHALPNYARLELVPGQFGRLESICAALNLSGNDMNDAYLAALALENDLTLASADRGFERFAGLKLVNPLALPYTDSD